MKNIEKIAIDSMVDKFAIDWNEGLKELSRAKTLIEEAQKEFKKVAGPIMTQGKEMGGMLLEDGVSEEAVKYFEERFTELVKIPFVLKKD